MIPLIKKKNIILDATILSTLMSCARLTDFRFNLHLVSSGGKSSSLEMGSLVHTILEWYHKSLIAGKSRTDAIDIGFAAGIEYQNGYLPTNKYLTDESEVGIVNTSDEDVLLAKNTMHEYFDYYKHDQWIPLFAEHVEQLVIYEDDEIRILWKAKLDLAVDTNNGIYPVDHKTMKQRRDSLSLNNQFMGQVILMKSRGIIINKIGFQKSLKASEKFIRPIISYSADRLLEWSQIILPFWAKQLLAYDEIGFFPPNFTHCENKYGFCQFKVVCEADTGIREETIRLNFIKGKPWEPHD